MALGCIRFGAGRQRDKTVLILDRRKYRYHKFISDIAGQDISEHKNNPARAVEAVRNWLRTESRLTDIPGAEYIMRRYRRFKGDLPDIARIAKLNPRRLTFADYSWTVFQWLEEAKKAVTTAA